jgi:hypothetical protein
MNSNVNRHGREEKVINISVGKLEGKRDLGVDESNIKFNIKIAQSV